METINSERVRSFLRWLADSEAYIHYIAVNYFYYAIVDIVDSMISKSYRDVFNYIDMANAGYKQLKKDGVVYAYGYPNENAYPVTIKAKVSKEVGKMCTYCLPYRIGGIKKGLGFLNWASIAFCRSWAMISSALASSPTISSRLMNSMEL